MRQPDEATQSFYTRSIIPVITLLSRVIVGVVFIFSGLVKAIDPTGFALKLGDYAAAGGLTHFLWLDLLIAMIISALEFTFGLCLLMGVYRRWTSVALLVAMLLMTPLTLYLAIYNPVSDCGCFGDALIITNWQTFFKNLILLACTFQLAIHYKTMSPLFSHKVYWFVALFAFFYCISFSSYNKNHLPLLDFRPYKMGANIPELMAIPEDAPADEYLFIYEKEGKKRGFTIEEVPANDTTWHFVEARLIKQGFIPKIASFDLYDEQGDHLTETILSHKGGLLLLIIPSFASADDSAIDEINNLFDYANDQQLLFYGVTGDGEEGIKEWKKSSGADYPFLQADQVLLKTMIRSNPGLILIKEGTILKKWHHHDIPNEDELKEVLDGYLSNNKKGSEEDRRIMQFILGFALPLLLVWIYDLFRNRRKKLKTINIQKI